MLRFIYNGNMATKSMNSLASTCMRCMSVQQSPQILGLRRPLRERLQVSLCGKMSENPVELPNGTTAIPFTTKNEHNEYYAKHRAIIQTKRLTNFLGDRLIEGQRVYVSGLIGYAEIQTANGKRGQSGFILPDELYRCEDGDGPESDLNEVKLFGRVENQPQNTDKSTFLHISTLFFDRNAQSIKKKIHQILIQDDDNLRQRASSADIGTNAFIHGFLRTRSVRTQDEKWRTIYSIQPHKLIFSQQREKNQQVDDSVQDNIE